MYFINEFTGERYNSAEECLKAEKVMKEEKEQLRKAKEEKEAQVAEAYGNMRDAMFKYFELLEPEELDRLYFNSIFDKFFLD